MSFTDIETDSTSVTVIRDPEQPGLLFIVTTQKAEWWSGQKISLEVIHEDDLNAWLRN